MPVFVDLGRLWAEADGTRVDPDAVVPEVVPLLDPGDILAHPFTKNAGAFVSREGTVHPLIFEAVRRGSDAWRRLQDLPSPHKLSLTLEAPDGTRLSLDLAQAGLEPPRP